jgi:uncharacterized membrane protein
MAANPFDPATALFARHAQHVVLIHFPIAGLIVGVGLDAVGQWSKQRKLADAAYYNLLIAALATVPVLVTGILAWRFALEGQQVKGILLLHLVFGCASVALICATWLVHFRNRRANRSLPNYRWIVEIAAVLAVSLTGHLGGFLTGVNGPV